MWKSNLPGARLLDLPDGRTDGLQRLYCIYISVSSTYQQESSFQHRCVHTFIDWQWQPTFSHNGYLSSACVLRPIIWMPLSQSSKPPNQESCLQIKPLSSISASGMNFSKHLHLMPVKPRLQPPLQRTR